MRLCGWDCLRVRLVVLARAEAPEGPSDVSDAAELVERSAQLRLEDDDDRDDDEEGSVAEQPGEKDQVEGRREHSHDREQDQADEDLGALRPAQQPKQLVEDEGDDGDIDDLDGTEVARDLHQLRPELVDEVRHRVNSSASNAICAYRRLPAC